MKRIYFSIILTALCFAPMLSSCLDVLDVAPDGNLTMEEVLADPNKTGALVAACYDELPAYGWLFYAWEDLFTALTDDAWNSYDFIATYVGQCYMGQNSASKHYLADPWAHLPATGNDGTWWNRFWKQIRRCSQVIEVIDRSAASDADKRRYKAEARVVKSWFYLELLKLCGKLPLLDGTVAYDADFSAMKREAVYDIVTKCIAVDCDAAIATSELPWRIDNVDNQQRATKALAHAIKATAYLFAASPLHNGGNNYWEEAFQVCRTAVNELKANGYQLNTVCTEPERFGKFGDAAAWYQYITNEMDFPQNRDKETIWQKRVPEEGYNGNLSARHAYFWCYLGSNASAGGITGPCPTQELVDAFETRSGEPILDLRQPYFDEKHLQQNFRPGTGYSDDDPFVNRDPRFYTTVLKNGDVIDWEYGLPLTVESYVGGAHAINFDVSINNYSRTGYFHRKMVPPGALGQNYPTHKYFRFAEMLLTYAEAAAEAGHLAEAKAAADEVRARVKMPPLPDLPQEDLILRIRNERRVELTYERQRYFDMRRWQKPDGNLEFQYKWATGMLIRKQPDNTFTYERVNTSSTFRFGFENKELLLPLPLSEAALLETITGEKWQNPGW